MFFNVECMQTISTCILFTLGSCACIVGNREKMRIVQGHQKLEEVKHYRYVIDFLSSIKVDSFLLDIYKGMYCK